MLIFIYECVFIISILLFTNEIELLCGNLVLKTEVHKYVETIQEDCLASHLVFSVDCFVSPIPLIFLAFKVNHEFLSSHTIRSHPNQQLLHDLHKRPSRLSFFFSLHFPLYLGFVKLFYVDASFSAYFDHVCPYSLAPNCGQDLLPKYPLFAASFYYLFPSFRTVLVMETNRTLLLSCTLHMDIYIFCPSMSADLPWLSTMMNSIPEKPLDMWRDVGQPLKDYNGRISFRDKVIEPPLPEILIVQIFSRGIWCGSSLRMAIGFCLRYLQKMVFSMISAFHGKIHLSSSFLAKRLDFIS